MSCDPAKERPCSLSSEISVSETTGRTSGLFTEPGIEPRVFGNVQRRQGIFGKFIPSFNEVREQCLIASAVFAQSAGRLFYRWIQKRGCAIVKRMRDGRWRVDPLHSMLMQRQSLEE